MNSTNYKKEHKSCFRTDLFTNQVALITGGGTGIGRCIGTELALLGAKHVIIASRNNEQCQHTAEEINQLLKQRRTQQNGVEVVVAGPSTNLRNEEDVKALVKFVVETFGAIHLLVNNAGGQFISPAEDISRNGFHAVVDTNLIGTFLMCREVYTQSMKPNGGGSIVNITIGNRNGMPCMVHSGAARAGVENMTATLCTEWIESNVRINCVRPGIIWTDSGFDNYGPAADMFIDRILPTLPAKRFGTAEEVSSAVVWLLSEGASYVTGTVVAVDGASAYTFLPLIVIDDSAHLQPYYGTLPNKARL
jgi:NAD(P)-dependent dehydrogenase (short-subunit alcohol dehydrogenase family)